MSTNHCRYCGSPLPAEYGTICHGGDIVECRKYAAARAEKAEADMAALADLLDELAPDRAYYEHEGDKGYYRCCDAMQYYSAHDPDCAFIKMRALVALRGREK